MQRLGGCMCSGNSSCRQHLVQIVEPDLQEYLDGDLIQEEFRDAPHQIQEQVPEVLKRSKEIVSSVSPCFFGFAGNGKSSFINSFFDCLGDKRWEVPMDRNADCTKEVLMYECRQPFAFIAGQTVSALAVDTPGWKFGVPPAPLIPLLQEEVRKRALVPQVFYSSLFFVFVVDMSSCSNIKNLHEDCVKVLLQDTCNAFRQEQKRFGVRADITLMIAVTNRDNIDSQAKNDNIDVDKHRTDLLCRVKKVVDEAVPDYVKVDYPILVCTKKGAGEESNMTEFRTRFEHLFFSQVQSLEIRLVLFQSAESAMFKSLRQALEDNDGVMDEGAVVRRAVWALARMHGFKVKELGKLFPKMKFPDGHKMCEVIRKELEQNKSKAAGPPRSLTSCKNLKELACPEHTDSTRVDWTRRKQQAASVTDQQGRGDEKKVPSPSLPEDALNSPAPDALQVSTPEVEVVQAGGEVDDDLQERNNIVEQEDAMDPPDAPEVSQEDAIGSPAPGALQVSQPDVEVYQAGGEVDDDLQERNNIVEQKDAMDPPDAPEVSQEDAIESPAPGALQVSQPGGEVDHVQERRHQFVERMKRGGAVQKLMHEAKLTLDILHDNNSSQQWAMQGLTVV